MLSFCLLCAYRVELDCYRIQMVHVFWQGWVGGGGGDAMAVNYTSFLSENKMQLNYLNNARQP